MTNDTSAHEDSADALEDAGIAALSLPSEPGFFTEEIDLGDGRTVIFTYSEKLEFSDVSDEEFRTYSWAGGHNVTYHRPLRLHVSASGGHRLFTADGMCHYVAKGWATISWKPLPGMEHFRF